jgi:hypothetical protein
MSVSVAGRLIQDASALSALGRLSLAFVDGGPEWLNWAITDATARYDLPDETTLVGQVQWGVHASRFALLRRLQLKVSPIKLMSIGLPDLRLLARAEGGDDSAVLAAQVRKILSDHRLATQTELAAGTALLAELGVASSPLFHAMEFDELLALWELACATPGNEQVPALQREAVAFAVQQAHTPLEFCDYYGVYVDCCAGLQSASPEQRAGAASAALEALLPLLFGALDCPQIDGLASPSDVALVVSNWLTRGKQLGFARLSQAVQQIVRHTHYQPGDGADAAPRAVRQYLQSAQAFLVGHPPAQGRLGQDGATCVFTVESASLRAQLQVGAGGVISLRDFGAIPSPAVPPSPAASLQEGQATSGP